MLAEGTYHLNPLSSALGGFFFLIPSPLRTVAPIVEWTRGWGEGEISTFV
jgi:hypothetical protein